MAVLSSAALILGCGLFMAARVPTMNPNAYILFLRSHDLFLEGKNEEAVKAGTDLIKKDPLYLSAYKLLGDAYQRLGDIDNALRCYFDMAFYSEKRHDKKSQSCAYIGIGWLYHMQGEYPRAFDFYSKAAALCAETKDSLNEAVALRKLAVWYIDKEDYDRALTLLTRSSEINRERQHIYEYRHNLACDYFDLGLVFMNKDDTASARKFYEKSSAIFKKMKLRHEESDYYFNIGEIYLSEKKYQKALECYNKGLSIDRQQGNKPNMVSDYNMLGELYLDMGRLDEAQKHFEDAITLGLKIKARSDLASAYHSMAVVSKLKGRKALSRDFLRAAQEIYRGLDAKSYNSMRDELAALD